MCVVVVASHAPHPTAVCPPPPLLDCTAHQRRGFAAKDKADKDAMMIEIPVPFKAHRIDPPSQTVKTSRTEIVSMFTQAYMMRRLEIAADVLYKGKFIRGFCHLYDGQEAVCVGMEAALTKEDAIVTSYRDHCTHLGRGGTPLEVMAELMGRVDGASKGMGGSMHMYKRDAHFFGGNGIVGEASSRAPILHFARPSHPSVHPSARTPARRRAGGCVCLLRVMGRKGSPYDTRASVLRRESEKNFDGKNKKKHPQNWNVSFLLPPFPPFAHAPTPTERHGVGSKRDNASLEPPPRTHRHRSGLQPRDEEKETHHETKSFFFFWFNSNTQMTRRRGVLCRGAPP